MKKANKFLSIFLALIMIISIIPMSVFTVSAEETETSGTCGENVYWTFDESTGTLTISGTGAMDNFIFNNRPWEKHVDDITTVVINDGVTIIGDYAFIYCENLTSVTIPDSVTTIGGAAFSSCDSLTNVTIPDSVTAIGGYAFEYCESLTSVTIPDSVTTIDYKAFYDCTSLTDVYYSGTEEEWSEITIGSSNDPLLNATIHFETEINELISGTCGENLIWTFDELTGTLTISGIGKMDNYNCYNSSLNPPWESYKSSIKKVIINNGVTTIGWNAFQGCTSLESVTIPESLETIGENAFGHCTGLTCINIPDNSIVSISREAFVFCTGLTSVNIPSATYISSLAFSECKNLTNITIDESVTMIDTSSFNGTGYYNNEENWENGVLYIGKHLVQANPVLIDINYTVKDGTKNIAISAFPYCNSLTSITIPDSVTTIGYFAFVDCDSLTSIKVDSNNQYYSSDEYGVLFNKDKTTLIQYPMGNTRANYIIPDGVTTIDEFAFFGCDSLTSVTIPDSVTTIGDGAFYDCTSLTDVYYSGTEEQWNEISIGSDNNPLLNATIHFNSTGECTHSYISFVTEPSCTEQGYTTYQCINCGDQYVGDYVEAPGHTPGTAEKENIIEPTCVIEGSYDNVVYCDVCWEELSRETIIITSPAHNFISVVTAPTCTEGGYTTYTCSYCGDTYTSDETPATGHNFVDGECTVCGEKDSTNITDKAKVVVSQKTLAIVGKQVKVAISLENNPGITSMLLNVDYDADKLQLVSVEDSGNLGAAYHSNVLNSPYTLSWANDTATENIAYNGEVVVLTFNILEDAELGETPITVTYDYNNYDIIDKDMNPVEFVVVDGFVNIIDVIIGDVNEDGKVNTLDRVILTRYIAKWGEYPAGSINTVAADVNCDGKVNTLDRVILTRYIAKWSGYETLPYTA